jgi:hypothetical protein
MKNQFSECFKVPVSNEKAKWTGSWLDKMKYAQKMSREGRAKKKNGRS